MAKKVELTAQPTHQPINIPELPEPGFSRLPAVMDLFACEKSTVYRWVRKGRLAPPVKFSPRHTAWRNSDLNAFLRSL